MDAVHETIYDFFKSYKTRSYDPGSVIARPGESIKYIYFIDSGRVREYDIASNGAEVVVNVLKSGSFFSLSQSMIDDKYAWFYDTLEPTELIAAPADRVKDFVLSNHDITLNFLKRLSSGSYGLQRRMAHLMGGTAKTRIVYELIVEFVRFGFLDATSGLLKIDVSEVELANRTGLSREIVSKELKKLVELKLIVKGYRFVSTSSVDVLKKYLGEEL